jgi:hypothetical protein
MRWKSGILVLLGSAFVLAAPARAAEPANELLRMVPEDVGLCLLIQDLRGHSADLLASPFVKTFAPVFRENIGSPELQKLAALDEQLQKLLGIDWARLRDDLLGDLVLFAYRPGPPGKPAQEQGLVLVRARDAALLADLCERINRAQKEAGSLKELTTRTHNGQTYYHRVDHQGESYYFLRGPVLAFASQETILRQAIDLARSPSGAEPPIARELRLLDIARPLATLWINPRAFDEAMAHNTAQARGVHAAFLATFTRYWKAVQGIALAVDLDKDVRLELAVRAVTDQLPPAARRFFSTASRPSALWGRFPENALLALAARVDLAALFEMVGEFLSSEDRQALRGYLERTIGAVVGKDLFKEMIPSLGPDFGLCITAPPAAEEAWFPHAIVAAAIQQGTGPMVGVDQAVLSAVDFYAQLAVVTYNRQHPDQLVLKTRIEGQSRIRYIVNDEHFPPGLQPAFGLQQGYLLLASSPEVLRRFGALLARESAERKSVEVPLLRLSLKDWHQFLIERREPLANYLAERNHTSRSDAGQQLDSLLRALRLMDRVELNQRAQPGQLHLVFRIRFAQPLK